MALGKKSKSRKLTKKDLAIAEIAKVDSIVYRGNTLTFGEAVNQTLDLKTGATNIDLKEIPEFQALSHVEKLEIFKEIIEKELAIYKPSRKSKMLRLSANYDSDYDGEEMEFDEDGNCIAGEEWDYPGSPYLDPENDIYGSSDD